VFSEPPQTITTDEELNELAHLQPTLEELNEWRILAVENGQHQDANDFLHLMVPLSYYYRLVDPEATSTELDWQLSDMLSRNLVNSKLASENELRPYDDPLDGAAMIAYQLERIRFRVDRYRIAESTLTSALRLAVPVMVSHAKRSRDRNLLARLQDGKSLVRSLVMIVESLLPVVKRVFQNYHLIAGRDLLFADEQRDRMQGWKQNLNLVTNGWQQIVDGLLSDSWRNTPLRERINVPSLIEMAIRQSMQTRTIKLDLKKLRILHTSYNMIAVEEAKARRQLTHARFRSNTAIRHSIVVFRNLYLNACRDGKPCYGRVVAISEIETKLDSDLIHEMQLLERCIHFLQISRISRKYSYQKWSVSTPRPVLPDYVREAVERHRKEYGAQSID